MQNLFDCLAEYGLSEKEAKVYLSMLELGPASVQDIAQKSTVNRATTYVMLEALKKRGLMSTFEKGKKTMFVAESPERLKRITETEMHQAEDKQKRLENVLPVFLSLYKSPNQDRPAVRFFEGEEGFAATRELYDAARGEILSFAAIDDQTLQAAQIDAQKRLEIINTHHGRNIVAIKDGFKMPPINNPNWRSKQVPYSTKPFSGEFIIFDGKVSIAVWNEKPVVVVIENMAISELLRAMFENMWLNAKDI